MQENKNQNQEVELDENHLIQIRKDKLKEIQEQGKDPFEITKFNRTNSAGEIKANYEEFEKRRKGFLYKNIGVLLVTFLYCFFVFMWLALRIVLTVLCSRNPVFSCFVDCRKLLPVFLLLRCNRRP